MPSCYIFRLWKYRRCVQAINRGQPNPLIIFNPTPFFSRQHHHTHAATQQASVLVHIQSCPCPEAVFRHALQLSVCHLDSLSAESGYHWSKSMSTSQCAQSWCFMLFSAELSFRRVLSAGANYKPCLFHMSCHSGSNGQSDGQRASFFFEPTVQSPQNAKCTKSRESI